MHASGNVKLHLAISETELNNDMSRHRMHVTVCDKEGEGGGRMGAVKEFTFKSDVDWYEVRWALTKNSSYDLAVRKMVRLFYQAPPMAV